MIGANHHEASQFTMGSGTGIEREFAQSGEGAEHLLKVVVEVEHGLAGIGRLQRMLTGKSPKGSQFLVDDRIVFHGATAQWIESVVHAEIVVRKIRVMTHDGHLVAFRQIGILRAKQVGWQFAEPVFIFVLG